MYPNCQVTFQFLCKYAKYSLYFCISCFLWHILYIYNFLILSLSLTLTPPYSDAHSLSLTQSDFHSLSLTWTVTYLYLVIHTCSKSHRYWLTVSCLSLTFNYSDYQTICIQHNLTCSDSLWLTITHWLVLNQTLNDLWTCSFTFSYSYLGSHSFWLLTSNIKEKIIVFGK